MKRFKWISRCVALIIFLLLTNNLSAQQSGSVFNADSVEISFLTCQPRDNVYSLYGHTAIRYQDRSQGIDVAVNYGMFSFGKPFFILRFVFGLTDYEMGIETFADFQRQYEHYGCGVWQQKLNLTSQEKAAIAQAIEKNYEPENRVYRYNYFYDNCTTRARDIIVNNINGKVVYANDHSEHHSYREMTHLYNENSRWARFGNDLLLGVKADMPTTYSQQQFLPFNMKRDFDNASVIGKDGSRRKLVTSSTWVVAPGVRAESGSFPLSPSGCAAVIAALILLATVVETLLHKKWWGIDLAFMLVTGLCGLILFAMIFSEHPTVSLNMQILLLNPLSLVFGWTAAKSLRKGKIHWWTKTWTILIVCFFVGGIFQDYAEGMSIVAQPLLLRNIVLWYRAEKKNIISLRNKK